MTDPPASPPASRLATPSWLDARLVLGVLLVLVSVVVGARVLASADNTQSVWVATRPLALGSTVSDADLERGQVRLFDKGARYLAATGAKPVGYVLARDVGAGELLPAASVVLPETAGRVLRDVSVPVEPGHLPQDLQSGELVDVYLTVPTPTGSDSAAVPTPTGSDSAVPTAAGQPPAPAAAGQPTATAAAGSSLLLESVPVRLRAGSDGAAGSSEQSVVLTVTERQAALLVSGLRSGAIDLSRVRRDAGLPALSGSGPAAG